jgi:hypothetical protein
LRQSQKSGSTPTEDLPGPQVSNPFIGIRGGDGSSSKQELHQSGRLFSPASLGWELRLHTLMKIPRFTLLAALLTSPAFAQTNTFPSSGNVGIGTSTPAQRLTISGTHGAPATSGSSADAVARFGSEVTNLVLDTGVQGGGGAFAWLQSRHQLDYSDNYVLALNPNGGNVGIGTSSPSYKFDVNGDARIGGAFRIGELYFSPPQFIQLGIGTERWVKLATIPNNHSVRFQLRNGSHNSEEIAEIKVFGTYHNDRTAISVERQTYYEHLREVRVVGSDGGPRTVYIKIRASDYAPAVSWRALDSRGSITIHNIEETPTAGLSHHVSGNLVTSTNTNLVTTGNIGIGTTSPQYKLYVKANSDGVVSYFGGAEASGIQGLYVIVGQNSAGGAESTLVTLKSSGVHGGPISLGTGNSEALRIRTDGNVGIGTTNPHHKLAVNGTIKAKEVIVETTGWSDYVFADDYRLAPLSEVEAHIKANKHLPGIPSAVQVAEKGVNLGDAQAALLAKVEELTLHLIAQQKQMESQQQTLASLQKENQRLERRLQQVEVR